jgi:hypothetical protein
VNKCLPCSSTSLQRASLLFCTACLPTFLSLLEAEINHFIFIYSNSVIHYSTTVMKFIYAVFALSAVVSSVSATPAILTKRCSGVPEDRIPQFGVQSNVTIPGSASCEGINGVQIPCQCPPPRAQFIAVILHRCLCSALFL